MNKHARLASHGLKFVALILAVFATGSAIGATTTASSTSTVVTPIAIAKGADLSFGNFASGSTSGTVTVSTSGTRTVTGGVVAAGGTTTAAQFNVTGQAGLNYSISMTGTSATLTSGANTMAFAAITDLTGGGATSGTVTSGTLTGGAQTVFVGGALTVGANQAAGTYTGAVSVAVDYQ